jgi:hypothetical protein
MSEQAMIDPLRENIDGEKLVHHRFKHGVDWRVNVSHLLVGAAVLVALAYLYRRDRANPDGDTKRLI